jgi:tetratricopeptide (TPR) repeat protein
VLAMSYSVLVKTAEMLFGAFYGNLVRGQGIGESLDNARRSLMQNPERGERSRGQERIVMRLEDWFVPTLYQSGSDRGMVSLEGGGGPPAPKFGGAEPGMPGTIAGFFGRRRELWAIERAFTPNPMEPQKETRRMTIAGFGGQGKTALAAEAGRWLLRTGMFEAVVFVDYQAFQGVDGVALAVSTIARDLDTNLIDADAVTEALGRKKTLVILDNLEDLQGAAQQALLSQAIAWSEAGQSRVLVTTRQNDLEHGGYGVRGYRHQLMALKGLGQEDAIDYFQGLMAVPPMPGALPGRRALIELFGKVDFHPLSIALVAEQLRVRSIVDVDRALDRLLAAVPVGQSKDRCLVASLNLSIDRLDGDARSLVRRLGVFQGGAFEDDLLAITEFTTEQWTPLRRQLESASLVRSEGLEHLGVWVPFLKFHPTLARVMWASLGEAEQTALQQRHRERYYALSGLLYNKDSKNPYAVRAIVQRELPNLLVAVRGALAAGEEWAVSFVDSVNSFLDYFGMSRDRADLTQRAENAAQSVAVGSQAWYLALTNVGERLLGVGQPQAAIGIFQEILAGLGETVNYDRCLILVRLGRCWATMGQPVQATTLYRQVLEDLAQLEPSDKVKQQMGGVQADLGNVLMVMGDYGAAREAYEASLAIDQELNNELGMAVLNIQFGTLAWKEGKLPEAETRYQSALITFRKIDEPAKEAGILHQLGMVYEDAQAWDKSEQAYRASAQLQEAHGNLAGAIMTWICLANVISSAGKPKDSEDWYRKAISEAKSIGNIFLVGQSLGNLANLLKTQSVDRLSEARQLAEEALTILETLDPAVAQPWIICTTLAKIATQQGETAKAQNYCRLSRHSYAAFAGSRHALQQWEKLIQGVVTAIENTEVRQQLNKVLPKGPVWFSTVAQRIWAGVRDEDELCDELGFVDGAIVVEILSRL